MRERLIAFHSLQRDRLSRRTDYGMVVLTEDEAAKLEDALRLARTGKVGKERPVSLTTPIGSVSTRIIVKGFVDEGGGDS